MDHEQKNRMELSYNLQLTIDYDSGIILANTITQDPTDHYQLILQIKQTIETVGPLNDDTAISANNGYYTKMNLQYLEDNELDGYIPNINKFMNIKNIYKQYPLF